jgi:uncharacterized protein (DUF58 family)
LNFEELRRYLPGDDVRTMDWRVTARTRKPHVRVYTEERDRPMQLIIDQRMSLFFGTRRVLKSVAAAETAALAAWRSLSSGDRVGGLVFDDESLHEIRPRRSRSSVLQLLRTVCEANQRLSADSGIEFRPEMLDRALERAAALSHHDHLVCIVSDFQGASLETPRHIARLAEHNDVLLLFIYDPAEARLPEAGRVVVSSGDLQLELDTSASSLRKRFDADFEKRLDRIRGLAQKYGTPVLPIESASEVAPQVRRLLGNLQPNVRSQGAAGR